MTLPTREYTTAYIKESREHGLLTGLEQIADAYADSVLLTRAEWKATIDPTAIAAKISVERFPGVESPLVADITRAAIAAIGEDGPCTHCDGTGCKACDAAVGEVDDG